jgi:hypothetical protein
VRRLTGFVLLPLACNSTREVEHVEFDPRMTQQMGEVSKSLCVL